MDTYEVVYQTERREVPDERTRKQMDRNGENIAGFEKFQRLEPYVHPAQEEHTLYFQVMKITNTEDGKTETGLALQLVREFPVQGKPTPFIQQSGKIYRHISVDDLIEAADTCYDSVDVGARLLDNLDVEERATEMKLERKREREDKKFAESEPFPPYAEPEASDYDAPAAVEEGLFAGMNDEEIEEALEGEDVQEIPAGAIDWVDKEGEQEE
ncbi:hypothetical protein KY335_03350 [Candidatus Woesearchaeota archaeon]|nr:hypothetical protein [Candidatus Woesearchaeota archaeon]